jgi:hypothetical protein
LINSAAFGSKLAADLSVKAEREPVLNARDSVLVSRHGAKHSFYTAIEIPAVNVENP